MKLSIEELLIIKWALEERAVAQSFSMRAAPTLTERDILSDQKRSTMLLIGKIELEIKGLRVG